MCVFILSVMSDPCDPIDCSLPGSSLHGILQERPGMGCHFLLTLCCSHISIGLHYFETFPRTKPVNPKGNQHWIFIGRTHAEAEAPIFWPPDGQSQLTGKDPDAVKDWGQEEKGVTRDEMVGCHHRLNGHGFEQTLRDSEGQWSPACCNLWGCRESDRT